jgi:hypothetical protein
MQQEPGRRDKVGGPVDRSNGVHFRASNSRAMRLELTPEAAEYLRTRPRPVALDYVGALG